MRRFTIAADGVDGDRVTFDAAESRHLARVLRLRAGDTVIASDGTGRELAVRLDSVGDVATGTIVDIRSGHPESPVHVTLLQGIPKGDKMETIVRAATELGVARVCPVIAERTVVRLEPNRWNERARRWQRVAREATKQCRRAVIPTIEPPRPLPDWLELLGPADLSMLRLCLWEGEAPSLASVLDRSVRRTDVCVLIGPEGGLAQAEVDLARDHGFEVASLGKRILRTETAATAAVTVLQWELGDLGG